MWRLFPFLLEKMRRPCQSYHIESALVGKHSSFSSFPILSVGWLLVSIFFSMRQSVAFHGWLMLNIFFLLAASVAALLQLIAAAMPHFYKFNFPHLSCNPIYFHWLIVDVSIILHDIGWSLLSVSCFGWISIWRIMLTKLELRSQTYAPVYCYPYNISFVQLVAVDAFGCHFCL